MLHFLPHLAGNWRQLQGEYTNLKLLYSNVPQNSVIDDEFTDLRAKTGEISAIFHYKLISSVKIHRAVKTDFKIAFGCFSFSSNVCAFLTTEFLIVEFQDVITSTETV